MNARPASRSTRSPVASKRIVRWTVAGVRQGEDALAVEEPLEIRVDTRSVAVVMRTPGHDEELAAGFLLTEGIVRQAEDLRGFRPAARNRDGNVLDVFLAPEVTVDFARLTRHVFAASSCGLCGKASIAAVRQQFPKVRSSMAVAAPALLGLPDTMRAAQSAFGSTGGIHAAALFDEAGKLLCLREDIGRHNAVDKVVGWALQARLLPLSRHVLLVSGRASFEILQKTLAAGIPVVAAVSAPSTLAVEFARASGQTLVGFLRDGRFNVYAGQRRIGGLRPVRRTGPA